MGRDVFISHSSQSNATATTIVRQLEQNDIHCWVAPRDLAPGSEWAEGIIDGIEECPVFLLILCPHTNSSPQVLREVERAVSKKKPIIPVMTGKFTLSKSLEYFISSHHWLEFTPKTARKNIKILVEIIQKKLSAQSNSSPEHLPLDLSQEMRSTLSLRSRKKLIAFLLTVSFLLSAWFLFHLFLRHPEPTAPQAPVADTMEQGTVKQRTARPATKLTSEDILDKETVQAEVFDVRNGNGFKVHINGKTTELRLYGIDAPAPHQEYDKAARDFLAQLVLGKQIRAVLLGKNDRRHTEAIAHSEGKILNKEMIRAGYAWKNSKHCQQEPLCSELDKIEQEARDQRLGIWQGDNPIPPWEWAQYQIRHQNASGSDAVRTSNPSPNNPPPSLPSEEGQ